MPDIYIDTGNTENSEKTEGTKRSQRKREPYHEAGALAAYSFHPDNIRFETQAKGEHIEVFLRRHPITNVPWILTAILMILAPLALSFAPFLEAFPPRFQLVSILIWYLLTSAFILESTLQWLFNIYIVTDERIVDIDFHNLIYKEISDASLGRIQDVTYTMGGVVRTLFNYGNVMVQTAGAAPNFEFEAVPNPAEVARLLQELRGHGKGVA